MKILIANVGSSSLKCQLLDMPAETVLARAHVERVGSDKAPVRWTDRAGKEHEIETPLPDIVTAIRFVLAKLTDPADGVLKNLDELDAVGFKASHAKGFTGTQILDERVLAGLSEYRNYICPLHNELYINSVRSFQQVLPNTPMIGHFEDFFSQQWPEHAKIFGVPYEWTEKHNLRKRMGHGSSHFYVNRRISQILGKKPEELNSVQFHLGGSSSVAAVQRGQTVDGTSGFSGGLGYRWIHGHLSVGAWRGHGRRDHRSPQPHQAAGRNLRHRFRHARPARGGRKGAPAGTTRHRLVRLQFPQAVRPPVFPAGQRGRHHVLPAARASRATYIRRRILENLGEFGIVLDDERSKACIKKEGLISSDASKIPIWVVPTNEEIVVARHCVKLLEQGAK